MPMLLILVPYVAGVLLAESYDLHVVWAIALCVVALVFAVVAMPRRVAWAYVAVALLLLGNIYATLREPIAPMPYNKDVEMVVSIEGVPSLRDGYSVADGRIERWRSGEGWCDADSRVVVWLRSDSITHGDRVTMIGRVGERISRHEDYDCLMHHRGFIGGVGVNDYNIIGVTHYEPTDLQSRAVARLDGCGSDDASHATVVAMVAGLRHDMPAELRSAYSTTGLAHLLAVSGLHLGIVMMVVGTLLLPLRLLHRGHRIAALMTIVAIWLYAIMSGASPSVVRAAIMLSVLQIAHASSSVYNSVNALSVTVFAMLLYRPDYIYDISFELSVAAVFGIVAWGAPLTRVARLWRRPVAGVFGLFVVGVVATLWTMPIVSHTFGNMPIIGVVITPCVLIFSYIVVVCGLFVVVLPAAVAMPFGVVAEWAAGVQNSVVMWAAELPFAAVEYTMTAWGVVLCYLVYAAITLILWSKNQKKVVTLPRYDFV